MTLEDYIAKIRWPSGGAIRSGSHPTQPTSSTSRSLPPSSSASPACLTTSPHARPRSPVATSARHAWRLHRLHRSRSISCGVARALDHPLVQLDVIAMQLQGMAKPLHRLSPRHRQAVALRLAGERPQSIADSLGVERRTVYLWFSDPLVKYELERRSRDLAKLVTERLAGHTLAALSRLREIIELPVSPQSLSPAEKLEVIREILDRCV